MEEKPSYADLVVIYNAEAQELDRLERKRSDMVAEYEASLQPSDDQAVAAIADVLGQLGQTAADPSKLETADPDELLDRAVESAEEFGNQTDAIREAVSNQLKNAKSDGASLESLYSDEFKAKLADLDAQIASQRERVEKARAARDAAEDK